MSNYDENLNNTYYPTIDENFNEALKLMEENLSHESILEFLKFGNILQKQIAALKLFEIKNEEESRILCENLVGQDGKIREMVSLRINELKQSSYFQNKYTYSMLLKALIDVNPNVCRNILEIISFLKRNTDFVSYFVPLLVGHVQTYIKEVQKFEFQDGKYKVNKEIFKLYWCLEAVYEMAEFIPTEYLKSIILHAKDIDEYTIREKIAKILSKNILLDDECIQIRKSLKQDKNYYVRRF